MKKTGSSVLCISLMFLAACGSVGDRRDPKSVEIPPPHSPVSNLTEMDAAARAQVVTQVAYRLELSLNAKGDHYEGTVEIPFGVKKIPEHPLFLDFNGGEVKSLSINGVKVEKVENVSGKVTLPSPLLKVSPENLVRVEFSHPYGNDGRGLYRFNDPEDGRVYLWTQFESYEANRMFPCFDQPDLKAAFTLTVQAPADWIVVSSVREKTAMTKGEGKFWSFPSTPRISTYLFSLHAGPYQVWNATAGKIPLRLMARKSLAKFVKPQEWFPVTKKGLKFYGDYFKFPYPFGKYDQLIVPDFNSGAMENVGAVTFSESYVSRGVKTEQEKESLSQVILHEMAHMWFGDLVTMRWWNGLWLNESFATFMASVALSRITEFKGAALSFYGYEKHWGYYEDKLITTHPIDGEVKDTATSRVIFDGITYGKGASVIRQLAFYVGEEKFRAGLQHYFQSKQFANADLNDFIEAIATASGKDLTSWSDLWLRRAGLDQVEANWNCEGGKIKTFALLQTPPKGEKDFRPHAAQVVFLSKSGSGLKVTKKIPVTYQGGRTDITSVVGQKCPQVVFPNFEDYDYVEVKLDEQSIAQLQTQLGSVQDDLTRSMIWHTLYEMVRDQELNLKKYGEWVLQELPKEKNIKIARFLLSTLRGGLNANSVLQYLPPDAERLKWVTRTEEMLWKQLKAAKPNSDWQKLYFDYYAGVVESNEGLEKLKNILTGESAVPGLKLDPDRRWGALHRLSEFDFPETDKRVAEEKKRDSSERGVQSAMAAEAIKPDANNKTKWFKLSTDEKSEMSEARRRAVMQSLYPFSQRALSRAFAKEFYSSLDVFVGTRESLFLSEFTRALVPSTCDKESGEEISFFLSSHKELPPNVAKILKVVRQEDERCVLVRAKRE